MVAEAPKEKGALFIRSKVSIQNNDSQQRLHLTASGAELLVAFLLITALITGTKHARILLIGQYILASQGNVR